MQETENTLAKEWALYLNEWFKTEEDLLPDAEVKAESDAIFDRLEKAATRRAVNPIERAVMFLFIDDSTLEIIDIPEGIKIRVGQIQPENRDRAMMLFDKMDGLNEILRGLRK